MKVSAFFATLLLIGVAASANASILGNFLTFDGLPDSVEDLSRSNIFDNNNNNVLDSGDDIVGVIDLEKFNGTSVTPAADKILAIFSVRLGTSFFGGAGFNHTALPLADPNSISSMLTANGFTTGSFVLDGSEILAVVEKVGAGNPFTGNPNPTTGIIPSLTTSAGWSLDLIGGLQGDDFFQTLASLTPGSPLFLLIDTNLDGILQISEIRANNGTIGLLNESAAMTVEYSTLPGAVFLPLTENKFSGGTGTGDITLQPSSSVSTSGGTGPTGTSNSDLIDRATFTVNAAPEPASVVAWAMLAGASAIYCAKRRK